VKVGTTSFQLVQIGQFGDTERGMLGSAPNKSRGEQLLQDLSLLIRLRPLAPTSGAQKFTLYRPVRCSATGMMLPPRRLERQLLDEAGRGSQGGRNMTRQQLMLAALAAGGQGASYSPVQVQKLFFLIDREVADAVGGPHFNFRAYDYGPFDSDVYGEIGGLKRAGHAEITAGYYRSYSLTPAGYELGQTLLGQIPAAARNFVTRSAGWVRSLSFSQLVSAIYKRYPEMKAASVFRE
jgi:hypothetical protein